MDVLTKINDAILDLQNASYQTYKQPLRKLGRLLESDELKDANEQLTKNIDLEKFLKEGEKTQGSMVGSAELDWPEDEREVMGLQLEMIRKFRADPEEILNIGRTFYHKQGRNDIGAAIEGVTDQMIVPFSRDYKRYIESIGIPKAPRFNGPSDKVFIVHGHDGEAKESVARYIEQIGLEATILHEKANSGQTIIEKIEKNSDVGFAIVLLTPDDEGRAKKDNELKSRARQNVILELGYFIGRLGRERVCALKKGDIEIPSDYQGIIWLDMSEGVGWKQEIANELKAAGYNIDWNKVMG